MGTLSAVLRDSLNEQYRHETSNSMRYSARASWARYRGLEATADFFDNQARDERAHAESIRKIIEDRNEILNPAPFSFDEPAEWTLFLELMESTLAIERETTESLQSIARASFDENDFLLFFALKDLLLEQIEEENKLQTILDRLGMCGPNLHDLDTWIGETFNK